MNELIRRAPLREYLTVRGGRYKDYRTTEKAILGRGKREGDPWKKAPLESNPTKGT
ncbi:MAG: hypothetical protein JRI95_10250 [Deltaproteobacteria bacterium]|nr:hypothetical protein [Deltaproteobacteria bacterium]MBW2085419.1 hypothetical protein [Deltaproteobacteria bacterium]